MPMKRAINVLLLEVQAIVKVGIHLQAEPKLAFPYWEYKKLIIYKVNFCHQINVLRTKSFKAVFDRKQRISKFRLGRARAMFNIFLSSHEPLFLINGC